LQTDRARKRTAIERRLEDEKRLLALYAQPEKPAVEGAGAEKVKRCPYCGGGNVKRLVKPRTWSYYCADCDCEIIKRDMTKFQKLYPIIGAHAIGSVAVDSR
jgi:DNA-directed RNA polymerase subunit RPC12/RpoP